MDRLSIQELDHLVKSGIWQGDPMMVADIYARFEVLIMQQPFPNFGTEAFWDVAMPFSQETDGGADDGGSPDGGGSADGGAGGGGSVDGGADDGSVQIGGGAGGADDGADGGGSVQNGDGAGGDSSVDDGAGGGSSVDGGADDGSVQIGGGAGGADDGADGGGSVQNGDGAGGDSSVDDGAGGGSSVDGGADDSSTDGGADGGGSVDGGADGGSDVGGGGQTGGGAAGGASGDGAKAYTLTATDKIYVKKFRTHGNFFRLQFHTEDNPLDTMRHALGEAIERAFVGAPENTLVGISVNHPHLEEPINVPFCDHRKMTPDNAMNLFSAVLQSATAVKIGSAMDIKVVRVDNPQAGVNVRSKQTARLMGVNALCMAKIDNSDNLCVARSVVYAVARLEQHDSEEAGRRWDRIRHGDSARYTAQRRAATELMERVGIPVGTKCGIPELVKIQAVVDYQIKAWDQHLNLFYESDTPTDKKIYLYFKDDHCVPINSVTAFMARSYFCDHCNVGYNDREHHKCPNICKYCLVKGAGHCPTVQWVQCADCRRRFPSQICLGQHTTLIGQERKTTCQLLKICQGCDAQIRTTEQHRCGQFKCGSCKQYDLAEGHQWRCYIQPIQEEEAAAKRPKKEVKSFIFFDLESRQDTHHDDRSTSHTPNFCVAQLVCDECKDSWSPDTPCGTCGVRQFIFEGDNTMDLFADWLFTPAHQGCTVFAHNMSGYDGQFVIRTALARGLRPNVIPRGNSIMTMTVEGIRFLDSMNFLPMALAALPKAFGFADQVLKGHFPHLFNTTDNQDYIGPYPDLQYFNPDHTKPAQRERLVKWHAEQTGKLFNFRDEIRRYCIDDVTILRRAALAFREIFMENTTVDPFLASITIPSACSLVFRKLFLNEETLGIVPHEGYRRNDKHSLMAIQWLKWISHDRSISIQHARNQGEFKIGNYKVDGFCQAENKVFEFHGCLFHGCTCIKNRQKQIPGSRMTMDDAYNRTQTRRLYFIDQGYQYEEVWQCEFQRDLRLSEEMAAFVSALDLVMPLEPRGAFFGGRTNAIVLHKTVADGERIEYADVVSLYPTVLKQHPFPLGHPEVITEGFLPITADHNPYFGLIKCELLPPRGLYHPVIPVRCAGKLQFPLCRLCAERLTEDCHHTDDERLLKGEWVSVEVDKALKLGYKLVTVHEIWHYARQSDPANTSSFFGAYVGQFLRLKAESTGYPSRVQTDEEKDAFIQEFFATEGVLLRKDKIEKNPGLRLISKLCLNSFWGKFGQRNNLPKMEFVDGSKRYFELVTDPASIVSGIDFVAEELVALHYTVPDAYVDALPNTNPVIAAFTTAYARLRLYSCLENLQERVLYFDTDSVIYTIRDGEWRPQMGETLGMMTDEITKDYGVGAKCDLFVGAGPKNYGLSIVNGDRRDTILKVRGITLDNNATKRINLDSMLAMVMHFVNPELEAPELLHIHYPQIIRTANHFVLTRHMQKVYKIVYNKRKILPTGYTLPWGY